jgi:hypothetical protein
MEVELAFQGQMTGPADEQRIGSALSVRETPPMFLIWGYAPGYQYSRAFGLKSAAQR